MTQMAGPDLPAGWSFVSLADVCGSARDAIVDGPFGSRLKRSDYSDSGVPVLKIQNVKPNQVVLKNMDFVSPVKFAELARHSYRKGDIVMTKLGDPLGIAAIVDEDEPGLIVADLVRIRPTGISTPFLCHQLNSPRVSESLNADQKGTTRPRINLGIVRNLRVAVPPLPEQQRIVEILEEQLSRLDAALDSVRVVREKAAQFRRSLLHAAFAGALVAGPLAPDALPEGWEEKSVGDLANGGAFFDGDWVESKDQDPEGAVRLTQLADVGEGQFRDRSDRWLRSDQADRLNVTYLSEGDLLIARMPDPLGRCCAMPALEEPAITVVDVAVLRLPPGGSDPAFVMWMLNSPDARNQIFALSSGTTRRRISRKNLATVCLPVPPPHEQRRIVEVLEEQFARLDASLAVADQIEKRSAALRRSLLHAAFTGRLTEQWREHADV